MSRAGASIAMGFAVTGMHYTGMAAASFTALSQPHAQATGVVFATTGLGAVVICATFVILFLALLSTTFDRAMERKNDELERYAWIVDSSQVPCPRHRCVLLAEDNLVDQQLVVRLLEKKATRWSWPEMVGRPCPRDRCSTRSKLLPLPRGRQLWTR